MNDAMTPGERSAMFVALESLFASVPHVADVLAEYSPAAVREIIVALGAQNREQAEQLRLHGATIIQDMERAAYDRGHKAGYILAENAVRETIADAERRVGFVREQLVPQLLMGLQELARENGIEIKVDGAKRMVEDW